MHPADKDNSIGKRVKGGAQARIINYWQAQDEPIGLPVSVPPGLDRRGDGLVFLMAPFVYFRKISCETPGVCKGYSIAVHRRHVCLMCCCFGKLYKQR
jgi:hypothetical protein